MLELGQGGQPAPLWRSILLLLRASPHSRRAFTLTAPIDKDLRIDYSNQR